MQAAARSEGRPAACPRTALIGGTAFRVDADTASVARRSVLVVGFPNAAAHVAIPKVREPSAVFGPHRMASLAALPAAPAPLGRNGVRRSPSAPRCPRRVTQRLAYAFAREIGHVSAACANAAGPVNGCALVPGPPSTRRRRRVVCALERRVLRTLIWRYYVPLNFQ